MEQRRVLLAIGLAFLVLYIWQALFVKSVPKPVTGQNVPASSAGASTPGASTPTTPAPTPEATPTPSTPSKAPRGPDATVIAASPLVSENAERDVRVETRDVIAVFTHRRARLKSWRVK